jgi:hypothetical protein
MATQRTAASVLFAFIATTTWEGRDPHFVRRTFHAQSVDIFAATNGIPIGSRCSVLNESFDLAHPIRLSGTKGADKDHGALEHFGHLRSGRGLTVQYSISLFLRLASSMSIWKLVSLAVLISQPLKAPRTKTSNDRKDCPIACSMNISHLRLYTSGELNNSIQHNDYIVILRARKAFNSPLLRSRNDPPHTEDASSSCDSTESMPNSIQHNDYIVILRATKALKSPLLRSRNDRCRTIRGVKTFPERDLEGAEQERARGEARLRFGDGVQEVLEEKSRAIHVREVVFSSKQQGVVSVVVTPVFSRASSLHPKKPCFKIV